MVAFLLLVVGGLNWGLVGIMNFDLVMWLFGDIIGMYMLADIVYIVVGVAAVYEILIHKTVCADCSDKAPSAAPSSPDTTQEM